MTCTKGKQGVPMRASLTFANWIGLIALTSALIGAGIMYSGETRARADAAVRAAERNHQSIMQMVRDSKEDHDVLIQLRTEIINMTEQLKKMTP